MTLAVSALLDLRTPTSVDLAADGTLVYAVARIDAAADETVVDVWLRQPGEDEPKRLSAGERRAMRLSPDARSLAYLRAVAGVPQLHVEPVGGEARRLTNVADGIAELVWLPDGSGLVAVAGASPAEGPHAPWTIGAGRCRRDGRPGPLPPGRLLHVGLDGAERELTSGADDRSPSVSPDGSSIAFARMGVGQWERPRGAIWSVAADGGDAKQWSHDLAFAISPSWSGDGSRLACFGTREARLGPEDAAVHVWALDAPGTPARRVAPTLDRGVPLPPLPATARGPAWVRGELVFPIADAGSIHLVAGAADSEAVRTVVDGDRQVVAYAVSGERIVYAAVAALDGGHVTVLDGGRRGLSWRIGRTARDQLAFEHRRFGGRDGWLLRPSRPVENAPLLVTLHGGPHGWAGTGSTAGHFHRYVLASRGWLVLSLNATGSGSYGESFADAIRGRWGEADLPEHLAAVDALVASGEADPERMAVAGYSYGGYLAAWTVANDHRFCAAVAGAPIADLRTFRATSDIGGWFTPFEMADSSDERYDELSPRTYAHRIRTPLLILCGEADERCPVTEGEILHDAVRRAGHAPVELVRYPGASHLFYSSGRPSQRVDYNRRIVDWLERWTG